MVLITGANGSNGAEIVKLFAARNIPMRAMVRDFEGPMKDFKLIAYTSSKAE